MINLLLVLILTLTSAAYAGAPQLITYQGTLRKAGAIHTGTVPMEFKLTNADGSVTYWTSGSTGVYVSAGLFRYPLGTPNEAQFAVIPWGTASPYVRVIVDGAALPADPLQSSPYALHAGTAEGSAGSFNLADGDLRISTTAGSRGIVFQDGSAQYTAAASGLWTASGADVYNSNAGNVGIGTTGPSQKLEVIGTVKATAFQGDGSAVANITAANIAGGSFANSAYTFPNNVTISGSLGAALNAGGFKITNLADPAAAQDGATKNYVDGLTGGGLPSAVLSATQTFTGQDSFTNQLSVSSHLFVTSGNVGVGTTQPDAPLVVDRAGAGTVFSAKSDGTQRLYVSVVGGDDNVDSGSSNLNFNGNILAFRTGGAEKLRVANNGNVGIATASPAALFTVGNGTLVASAAGNVGIGTANPVYNLDVNGPAKFQNGMTFGNGWTGQAVDIHSDGSALYLGAAAAGIFFRPQGAGVNTNASVLDPAGNLGVGNIAPAARLHVSSANALSADTLFLVSSGTAAGQELVVVKGNGNVGIGTTSPQDKLDIADGALRIQRYGGINLISNPTPGNVLGMRIRPDAGISGTTIEFNGWNFTGGASTAINTVFTGGGNVGIGTTGPNSKLDVKGELEVGAASRGASITSSATDNFQIKTWTNTPNPNFDIGIGNGAGGIATTWLHGDSAGSIGIGTTGPASKLTVQDGDIRISTTTGSRGVIFQDGSIQQFSGKVINVTYRVNATRTPMSVSSSIIMESFTVDKKSSTSNLIIQGTISGWGNASGDMQQGWKLGSGTEFPAQSVMYSDGGAGANYSKIYQTGAVISGHATTGPQTMVFRYYNNNGAATEYPFVTYNPNSTDQNRMAQTRSVYTVWEVEPQ